MLVKKPYTLRAERRERKKLGEKKKVVMSPLNERKREKKKKSTEFTYVVYQMEIGRERVQSGGVY